MGFLTYLNDHFRPRYVRAPLRHGRNDDLVGFMIDTSPDSFDSVVAHYKKHGFDIRPYTTKQLHRVEERVNLGTSTVPAGNEGRIMVEPYEGFRLSCSPTSIGEMMAWVVSEHAQNNARGKLHSIPIDAVPFTTRLYVPDAIDHAIKTYPWERHKDEADALFEDMLRRMADKNLAIGTPEGPMRIETYVVDPKKN